MNDERVLPASREIEQATASTPAEAPKADAEKPPLSLLDGEFLRDVAMALSWSPLSSKEDPRDAAAEALELLFEWFGGQDGGGRTNAEQAQDAPCTLAAAAARLAAAIEAALLNLMVSVAI